MIVYPLTVIHLILSYNVRLFNYLQAVVVLMGRLVCGVVSIASTLACKILDMSVRKIA